MATFHYKAKDTTGQQKTGTIKAADKNAVVSLLRDRKLIPLEIRSQSDEFSLGAMMEKLHGIGMKDKVVFTRQLAAIINAGIPLLQALQLIVDQTSNKQLQEVVKTVLDDIQGGKTFADALSRHPRVFSNLFINIVKAGEVSGTLDDSLTRLADQMEKDSEVQGKIKGAMVLPALVLLVMVGVIILMSVAVIPQLADLFSEAGSALPLPTRVMLLLSDFLINLWWLAILLTGIGIYVVTTFLRSTQGKILADVVILRVPVFGNLSKLVIYTRFTKVLAMLLKSGVPLLKGMEIVGDLVGNHIYNDSIKRVAKKVEKGVPLSTGIQEETIYPPMVAQMIGIGEQTGGIDDMLFKLANFYQNEVDNIIKNLTTLLEPMLMLMMGGAVGFVVMAVLMPIYNLVNVIE